MSLHRADHKISRMSGDCLLTVSRLSLASAGANSAVICCHHEETCATRMRTGSFNRGDRAVGQNWLNRLLLFLSSCTLIEMI